MSSQKSFTPFSLFKAKTFSTITSLRLKNKQFADFIQKVFYKGKKKNKKKQVVLPQHVRSHRSMRRGVHR